MHYTEKMTAGVVSLLTVGFAFLNILLVKHSDFEICMNILFFTA